MSLAKKILALTAQEKADGAAIVLACDSLKASLATAGTKLVAAETAIASLSEQITALSGQVVGVPELLAEIAALRTELEEANAAADTIAEINASPAIEVAPTVETEVESGNEPIE